MVTEQKKESQRERERERKRGKRKVRERASKAIPPLSISVKSNSALKISRKSPL